MPFCFVWKGQKDYEIFGSHLVILLENVLNILLISDFLFVNMYGLHKYEKEFPWPWVDF